jgi:pimeloyl-ACP methyl ester carboxylesterase
MGYSLNWRKIANDFQKDRQVLIFDQRGHGKSFQPESGYRPEDYANDLGEMVNEFGWEQIDLVGHSMGGRNALNYSYRFSTRIRRLVIEDIGPEVAAGSLQRIKNLVKVIPTPFVDRKSAKTFFMDEYPQLISNSPQAKTLSQYFYANMVDMDDGTVSWRFKLEAIFNSLSEGRSHDRWHEWESLSMPVLIVRGENSEDLKRETFERMLACNPRSRGLEIKESGHWVHFEKPGEFITALRRFFDFPESEIFRENFDFLETTS